MNTRIISRSASIFAVACSVILCLPQLTHGATIFATLNQTSSTEETALISFFLDTESANITVAEGTLTTSIPTSVIRGIIPHESSFSLWPNKPSLSGRDIQFVGGAPGGVIGDQIPLFSVVASRSKLPSEIFLSGKDVFVYLNNTNGTRNPVTIKKRVAMASSATPSTVTEMVINDTTPPEPFTLEVSQSPDLFDGKPFVSFWTVDTGSGIARYEIREGSYPPVRAQSPYVIRDPGQASKISVTAIDRAGNRQTAHIEPPSAGTMLLSKPVLLVAIGALLIGGFVALRKRRAKISRT